MKTVDAIIIGAGLTGLTTAHYLKKNNKSFIVLEKNDRVGGVIHTVNQDGFILESGPNTGVVGQPEVVDVFDDLSNNCQIELAGKHVNKRNILKNGKWEALPLGIKAGITTPLFTMKDKFRILGEPFRAKGTNPHESLADFVKRRLGESILNFAIDPFILGVYAGDPSILVPKYALPKLYNLEQDYGSLIGGSIKKMFSKKDPEQKKVTRKVFSAKGGLSSLTNALHQSAGKENFLLGAKNITIIPLDNGYSVKVSQNNETIELKAKHLITTTGAYELEKLLPFIEVSKLDTITNLYYTRVNEVVLAFKKYDGIPLEGFGGLIPFVENRDILGILYLSSLFEGRAPADGAFFTIFMGGVRKPHLIELSDAEIHNLIERECRDLLKMKTFNPDIFTIHRYEKAIPQYTENSGVRFQTIDELQQQYKGLQICGNLRDGIGMADRMKQGKMLAMKVI
jgi:oxygen-dependent protoporphyrinogen oxidase